MTEQKNITKSEYTGLEKAYEFFNRRLFSGSALPSVLFTLHRHPKALGYAWANRWDHRKQTGKAHELALNPDTFEGRSDLDILSTLVHEMAHIWQFEFGKIPRKGYHDRQWAAKMVEIGLQPVSIGSDGRPDGKETGQRVTHKIIKDGRFELAAKELIARGWALGWESRTLTVAERKEKKAKSASKTKYTCEGCGVNAWAKPDVNLTCADCELPMLAA
jgi:hypothetical protein